MEGSWVPFSSIRVNDIDRGDTVGYETDGATKDQAVLDLAASSRAGALAELINFCAASPVGDTAASLTL